MKKLQNSYGYIVVLVIIFMIGLVMSLPKILAEEENTDSLYYVGDTDGGHYFLQPSSEYEKVIFVDNKDVEEWSLDLEGMEQGQKFTATFTDSTLWEIERIDYDAELDAEIVGLMDELFE